MPTHLTPAPLHNLPPRCFPDTRLTLTITGLTNILNALQATDFVPAHGETLRRRARRGKILTFQVGEDGRFHWGALQNGSEGSHPKRSGSRIGNLNSAIGIAIGTTLHPQAIRNKKTHNR